MAAQIGVDVAEHMPVTSSPSSIERPTSSVTRVQALALRAKLFRGFSDASRLAILDALQDGPQSVGQIVTRTSLSQPNVSNHLSCLLDCGLVARTQQGRYAYYQLGDDRVAVLLNLADELLREVAKGVYTCSHYTSPVDGLADSQEERHQ